MSEIDVYAHEFCGTVANVPLYHLLEETRDNSDLAGLGPEQLLLGGGSGEHPAASFDILSSVYALLLSDEWEKTMWDGTPRLYEFPQSRVDALLDAWPDAHTRVAGNFSNWGGDAWYAFINNAKVNSHWGRNYDPDAVGGIENWVEQVIGEYALVSMLNKVVSLLPAKLSAEIMAFSKAVAERPLMLGVVSYPVGYEHLGGRRDALGDGNVRH